MEYWYDKEFKGLICKPDCTEEWLELIWAIGVDYDGCHSVESLKGLIDELMEMTQKARRCLYDGKVFVNEDEDASSWKAAQEERKRYENGQDL